MVDLRVYYHMSFNQQAPKSISKKKGEIKGVLQQI